MPRKASPSATKWSRSPRPRLLAALDRLDGVLDQVGERLAYLAAVAGHHQGLRWRRVAELHLRLRRALQEYSLLDEPADRSEEHTSELQSLMRISYAVFCLKKKKTPVRSTQRVGLHQQ